MRTESNASEGAFNISVTGSTISERSLAEAVRDNLVASPALPPRENRTENVVRSLSSEVRDNDDGQPTMTGHFAVFNEWTEIDSIWEGRFMERIAPGAFKKTFKENRDNIKVLYDHGNDPTIGNKPLGTIQELSEDEKGASYEVDLLDTSYNRDLVPALKAGLLGASFRFRITREELNEDAEPSEHNPRGLPERTIQEVKVMEFGPVTFPAYQGATASVRSLTDEVMIDRILRDRERARSLFTKFLPVGDAEEADEPEETTDAPEEDRAEQEAHPVESRRVSNRPLFGLSQETEPSWKL